MPEPARIAIDLGAESCRVRYFVGSSQPTLEVIHRIPTACASRKVDALAVNSILAGLEEASARLPAAPKASPPSLSIVGRRLCAHGPDGQPCSYLSVIAMCEPTREASDG